MSALNTFRSTLRRHERRARRMGLSNVAGTIACVRVDVPRMDAENMARDEQWLRRGASFGVVDCDRHRRVRWFYERAADAVARLRGAT